MNQLRENIINQVIRSVDADLIEHLIEDSLQKLTDKSVHPFIILRFTDKLKFTLSEIEQSGITEKEKINVTKALLVLHNYEVKKIPG